MSFGSSVVPTLKNSNGAQGYTPVQNGDTIGCSDSTLITAADALRQHTDDLFSVNLKTETFSAYAKILLEIDPAMEEEHYRLDINGTITIAAAGCKGISRGCVTLLQLMLASRAEENVLRVSNGSIYDYPDASYRGLMLDVARSFHSPQLLRKMILVCYWYKINYLHLHLSDDGMFTFPWTPLLPYLKDREHYTVEQLLDLNEFAAARGVTLLPEIDMPGHSEFLIKAMPWLFAPKSSPESCSAICAGREEVYKAIDSIIGELCSIFKSSPYIHIGGDEVNLKIWDNCEDCSAYKEEHGLSSSAELYRHFLNRVNRIVKKHHRKTMLWEGFSNEGEPEIDKDICVMEYESLYNLPQNVVAGGYQVINCTWQPLYYVPSHNWSMEKIYEWNMYRWESCWEASAAYPDGIQLEKSDQIIGAQFCSWENPAENVSESVCQRLPAVSQRIWEIDKKICFSDFQSRVQQADVGLHKLLMKVHTN